MKIDFVKGGEEFTLPTVGVDSDIQMTVDLLKLRLRVERETARELDVNLHDVRRELEKKRHDPSFQLSDDASDFNTISSIQLNLDTVYYVLHRVDPRVTVEQVRTLGKRLPEFIMAIFPSPQKEDEKGDFPGATQPVAEKTD